MRRSFTRARPPPLGFTSFVAFETGSSMGAALSGSARKKTWEVLLEHMIFVALLRRDVPSVPLALNKFVWAKHYD